MAMAFNAKQSAIALFPVGLIAATWNTTSSENQHSTLFRNLALYIGVFCILTFLLNPIWWNQPIESIKESWDSRQELLTRQVADTQRLAPEKTLNTPLERAVILIANLYIMPPSFYEVGNYVQQTAKAEIQGRRL